MIFGKKGKPPKSRLLILDEVSCTDCRFMREEDMDGKEGHVCLALARRRIDLREKRECQRFSKKAVERKTDVEIEKTIRGTDDVFDLKNLYKLMSGQDM